MVAVVSVAAASLFAHKYREISRRPTNPNLIKPEPLRPVNEPSLAAANAARRTSTKAGQASDSIPSVPFTRCGSERVTCVVDGDTFWLNGDKVRIIDIDAPEISKPKCSEELALGKIATERLIALLNDGPFDLVKEGRDRDRFGRLLRLVQRDGKSLGAQLVNEGLAHRWNGRKQPWC
jgi:micrococcal nuclease